MRRSNPDEWLWSFADILMLSFFAVCSLALLLMASINPPAKSSESVPPPGQMAVTMSWEPGPIDVDAWLWAPGETVAVGYSHKSGEVWSLLRDDLGTSNDSSPINQENAFARITPPGEWIINAHCFSCLGPTVVYVEVALGHSAGEMRLIFKGEVTIIPKEERTVIRFKLDGHGDIIPGSVNHVYHPLRSAKP
jgi:hypothetical protein